MRKIKAEVITQMVSQLCVQSNIFLRPDVLLVLRKAIKKESHPLSRQALLAIIHNAEIARREKLAICQDTGLPLVIVEVGQEVKIEGDLKKAVQKGVARGYENAYLRNSIVSDPLLRGKPGYGPALIHIDMTKGSRIRITVLPKGFGCENKSALRMFNPTANVNQIKEFIVQTVKDAGPDACPPYIVGVGIGGTADYACWLAKKALLRKIKISKRIKNFKDRLEQELLFEINRLGVGVMGLGGKITCLAVHVNTYPTHIAGLPVAVNISCHALRSASTLI